MSEKKLDPELVQMFFYGSDEQIITLDNVRESIESFLFEKIRIEGNSFVSSVRRSLAGNLVALLEGLGYPRLHKEMKKATGFEKEALADKQIGMIGQAVLLQLAESDRQPERMMLEKLLER